MSKINIKKTRCGDCDALLQHTGQPQKIQGVVMHPGFRYCTGFHRPRCFRNSDPKIHVPSWCPKRLQPAALRIYSFKSDIARYLYNEVGGILASRYILRYAGTTTQSANEILAKGVPEGQHLSEGEVLELDDGIRPIFFYRKNKRLHVTAFDKNRVEESNHQPN